MILKTVVAEDAVLLLLLRNKCDIYLDRHNARK
jgi:hypothetical protein